MEKYLVLLYEKMSRAASIEKSLGARQYMRNQFEFLGVDAPSRQLIVREFLKEQGFPDPVNLKNLIGELWKREEREYQYIAIEFIQKVIKKLQENDIEWIEELIISKSWWDTVDGLSASVCGSYFKMYPGKIQEVTHRWIHSDNIWLQRSALLFQLKYKTQTDTTLLAKYIEHLLGSTEFFINKSIGWVLREYSKVDKIWVKNFVDSHTLANLSRREASKYL